MGAGCRLPVAGYPAEGAGRGSNADFSRLCWFSMGSCNELESQLLLARDVKFINPDVHVRFENDISSVRQMLTRFIQTLNDSH
jgi:four helix bundle protein